jgi:ADP-dependent NAD(P)H-hydrate dehydratase / NAD(P)H-hydrate epimerase
MKVLSAAEMQQCDRATTERFGIPSIDLMRNASEAVAKFALKQFRGMQSATVLCGRGNNGGDGMMTARLLDAAGVAVTVLVLCNPDELKGDAAESWRELKTTFCHVAQIREPADLNQHAGALQTDLIVDAVLGTGFKPPMRGLPLAALEWIKAATAPILAIDLPSGWPADNTHGTSNDPVFPADAVITFTAPKPAHVFGQLTRRWDQPVVVAPIGSPDGAIASELNQYWAGSAHHLIKQPRPFDSNKGKFGHVLVVGGSFGSSGGKAGAPAMTSFAAMRAGAGLVTAAVPAPAFPIVSSYAPELMTWPLQTNDAGQASPQNLDPATLAAMTKGMTVLAIGPGLGQSDDTAKFCIELLEATSMPAVIDADGLNILSQHPDALSRLAQKGRTIVLTPHPGEMGRLAGISTQDVQADRLTVARAFAQKHGVILVLKGVHTLIAHPDGRVAVNTTGNPAMAKGGSGDLLTGLIAGLLAQFPDQAGQAIEAAVYVHGLAADLAVRAEDEHTLLATDTLAYFSQAFRFRSRARNGYVWLQGLPAESTPPKLPHEAAE